MQSIEALEAEKNDDATFITFLMIAFVKTPSFVDPDIVKLVKGTFILNYNYHHVLIYLVLFSQSFFRCELVVTKSDYRHSMNSSPMLLKKCDENNNNLRIIFSVVKHASNKNKKIR